MRVSGVDLENCLSHRNTHLTFAPDARVVLIAGDNGIGKTGILQAIRLALTGDPVRGVEQKNQLSALISHGAEQGFVGVRVDHGGAELGYRVSLKTGNYSSSGKPDFPLLAWALDPKGFLTLPLGERRKRLLGLGGVSLKPSQIIADLKARGFPEARVEALGEHLKAGFDSAADQCKRLAAEARGGWKATTGETYGSDKAAKWEAAKPEPSKDKVATAEEVAKLESELAVARGAVSTMDAAERQWTTAQTLNEQAKGREAAAAAVKGHEDKLELIARRIESLTEAATYAGGWTCACPSCGTLLMSPKPGELVEDKPMETSAPQAARLLNEAKVERRDEEAKLGIARTALANAEAAQRMLGVLPERPDAAKLAAERLNVTRIETELRVAQASQNAAATYRKAVDAAAESTKRAAAFHEQVQGYTALEQAVRDLPALYTRKALGPLNDMLREASVGLDAVVQFGEDGETYLGQTPYWLASAAQQLRIEAAVGYAIARCTGYKVVMIDALDTLHPARRGVFLQWLLSQEHVQFVVTATLKAPPPALPGLQSIWLGDNAA